MIQNLKRIVTMSITYRTLNQTFNFVRNSIRQSFIIKKLRRRIETRKIETDLKAVIHESLAFRSIKRVHAYLESLHYKIYMIWTNLLPEIRWESWVTKHLMSPLIIIITILVFFSSAKTHFSTRTITVVVGCSLSFMLGAIMGYKDSTTVTAEIKPKTVLKIGLAMLFIGYLAFTYQIRIAGGIPLFSEDVRRRLLPLYTMTSWSIVPGSLYTISSLKTSRNIEEKAKTRFKSLLILVPSLIAVILLAYRTEVVALLIGYLVVAYYMELVSLMEIGIAVIMSSLLYLGISVLRYWLIGVAFSPLQTVLIRNTVTCSNLDLLIEKYGIGGLTKGSLHWAVLSSMFRSLPGPKIAPRRIVAFLLRGTPYISMTSTLYGPLIIDFGLIGALIILLLYGFIIGLGYGLSMKPNCKPLLGPYSTMIAYTIVAVETGLLDLNVYIYIAISVSILLASIKVHR